MARKWIAAALALTLALALTGCGGDRAGTAAYRWEPNQAVQRQQEARGPLEDRADGVYRADENGRVNGGGQQAGKHMEQAGKDLGQAGKDLGKAARDAAQRVGDGAEKALDQAAGRGKDAKG